MCQPNRKVLQGILLVVYLIIGVLIIKINYSIIGLVDFISIYKIIPAQYVFLVKPLITQLIILMEFFLLLFIFVIKIDKKSLQEVGVFFNRNTFIMFMYGTFIAIFCASITWLSYIRGCGYNYLFNPKLIDIITIMLLWALASLMQAGYEELLFRSWLLVSLKEMCGIKNAIAIGSILFGVIHLLNQNYSVLGIVNGFIIGIIL